MAGGICRRRPVCSTGLLLGLLVRGVASPNPHLETSRQQQRSRRDRFVYQGFNGATVKIDRAQLARDQAAAGWTKETSPEAASPASGAEGPTFSVIVVHWRPHPTNLFRDKERVRAFAGASGGVVASVQFASPFPQDTCSSNSSGHPSTPPFSAGHPDGADKRVRVVHVSDLVEQGHGLDARQVSHLKAACEDPSETVVLVMVDETCQRPGVPRGVPRACLSNVVRIYPFNAASPDDVEWRHAYMPLGPRDTFPFVAFSGQRAASDRPLLFNLEVSARTSKRRDELITITARYTDKHPEVPCATQGKKPLSAEQWQDLLLSSKFTLSPGGHNAETFRTWEALEAGSIPIVSKLDFTNPAYNGTYNCGVGPVAWNVVAASPFAQEVSVADWTELPALLDRLRREPDDYIDRLQVASHSWYEALMKQTYTSMLNFGEGHELLPQEGPIVQDFDAST